MPSEIKIINKKKRCPKCGQIKSIEEFHKSSFTKCGLMSQCKECRRKSYYLPNRKKILEKKRNHYHKHKNEMREYGRNWYRLNREKSAIYCRNYALRLKLEVLTHYGGNPPKCAHCGIEDIRVLTIDHTDNDGAEHRKRHNIHSGRSTYSWLKKNNFPEGFQVLCWNCNHAKALVLIKKVDK